MSKKSKKTPQIIWLEKHLFDDFGISQGVRLPGIDYFVGRARGMQDVIQTARPKFAEWRADTKSRLRKFSKLNKQEFSRAGDIFKHQFEQATTQHRDELVSQTLGFLGDLQQGVMVRDKATGAPLKLEPSITAAFTPSNKYFRGIDTSWSQSTAVSRFGKAARFQSVIEDHLRNPSSRISDITEYDEAVAEMSSTAYGPFRPYKKGNLGTGELLGTMDGREVLIIPLKQMIPDYIFEDIKEKTPTANFPFDFEPPELELDIDLERVFDASLGIFDPGPAPKRLPITSGSSSGSGLPLPFPMLSPVASPSSSPLLSPLPSPYITPVGSPKGKQKVLGKATLTPKASPTPTPFQE